MMRVRVDQCSTRVPPFATFDDINNTPFDAISGPKRCTVDFQGHLRSVGQLLLRAPGASAIQGKVSRKRPYVASSPRVFVVDAEHVIASTLATILKMNGYSATFFTSALEALAAAQLSAPDLLISDVVMPGLSGVDLAIQIKAECPECKILLFSGQASTQYLLEDAHSQGHNFELLQKPVHPSVILMSLEALAAVPKKEPRVLMMPRRTGTS
jgi:CheY-like chemotaxis protein